MSNLRKVFLDIRILNKYTHTKTLSCILSEKATIHCQLGPWSLPIKGQRQMLSYLTTLNRQLCPMCFRAWTCILFKLHRCCWCLRNGGIQGNVHQATYTEQRRSQFGTAHYVEHFCIVYLFCGCRFLSLNSDNVEIGSRQKAITYTSYSNALISL